MLDIKFIRENLDMVKKAMKDRGVSMNINAVLAADKAYRKARTELEEARALHKRISEEFHKLPSEDEMPAKEDKLFIQANQAGERVQELEIALKTLKENLDVFLVQLPNIPLSDVPVGPDETGNKTLRSWGEPRTFNFTPRDHLDIGEALNIIDTKRAAKITGSRFAYLKGGAAILEFAIIQYVITKLTNGQFIQDLLDEHNLSVVAKPFTLIVPPVMIRPDVFRRMARLTDADKDERYHLPQDDLYLVGSAEHTLGSMHMDEILERKELPLRYLGFSTCFRREAGSYGKDTRGILRVHQFDKLEMESFTLATDSTQEQELFVAIQEHLLQQLNLPYRVTAICTGDMGIPDARQIDIETWMPGQEKYRETHTADLMTDYQARRLNTRVRRDKGMELIHTNDATAIAVGRTIIAIIENYQNADGSITIPEVLRPYMGGMEVIK